MIGLNPASMVNFGSPKSISDITAAAGWVVLDCDKNSLEQEIRLVCRGDDEAACNHLLEHGEPVNKLIRLPEDCGAGPFARIASFGVAEDQSLPTHVEGKLRKRGNGASLKVHTLKMDVDFAAIDPSKTGPVSFVLVGGNTPRLVLSLAQTTPSSSQLHTRDTDGLFDAVKKLAGNFQRQVDLLKLRQTCGNAALSLDVSVDGKAHAVVQVGVVASGTIIPPHMAKFGAFADLTADLETHLRVNAQLQGSIDTGRKTLFKTNVEGFNVPGIFSATPELSIDGHVVAQLDISMNLDVGVGYQIDGLQLWLPASAGHSATKSITRKATPLSISASPNDSARGTIEGHILPSVQLRFSGLADQINADASLEVDAFAKLQLDAQAVTAGSKGRRGADIEVSNGYTPPYDKQARTLATRATDISDAGPFKGCIDLTAGISITGKGSGNILGLLDFDKQISIFNKQFQVVKKCWNGGVVSRNLSFMLEGRSGDIGPMCPKSSAPLSTVDNETIPPSVV
ncbi:hypothetical protein EYR40_006006 [Pleurotus pulmonarius]|nr:hypothetical protein EYR40_006006 [Pleurotus pulmonarius]